MQDDWPWPRLCRIVAALAALGLAGCDSTGIGDVPRIAFVEVTSPINTIIAVGRDAQLTAVARDDQGNVVVREFTWLSSNEAVATVSTTGLVRGIASGNVTITAQAEGGSGSLPMRIVSADLSAISDILTDPLRPHLVTRLSSARSAVESALTACDQALTAGNIVLVNETLTAIRAQASSATGPEDRALLATLVLMTDSAIRLLHL